MCCLARLADTAESSCVVGWSAETDVEMLFGFINNCGGIVEWLQQMKGSPHARRIGSRGGGVASAARLIFFLRRGFSSALKLINYALKVLGPGPHAALPVCLVPARSASGLCDQHWGLQRQGHQ